MKNVLIVEDDTAIRESLKELLETEGYGVSTAENGEEALLFMRRRREIPALILLDLAMPVMDGAQFRRAQCADPRLAGIPTLVMTAAGAIEERFVDTTVVAVLRKPLDVDPFLELVKEAIDWESESLRARDGS